MAEFGVSIRTALILTLIVAACQAFGSSLGVDPDGPFETHLSAYPFLVGGDPNSPSDELIRYDLNTPHFADHSSLERYLHLPEREQLVYSKEAGIEFPIGTVLVLNVGPSGVSDSGQSDRTVMETRLLLRSSSGWRTAIYVHEAGGEDAKLSLAGGEVTRPRLGQNGSPNSHIHHVPNVNQCKMCHENSDGIVPLGPADIRNLNRSIKVGDEWVNQLEYWCERGWITGLPEDLTVLGAFPRWDDPSTGTIEQRARAYLDVNCSSCHRPGGLADTSGLDLRFDQSNPVKYGVFKAPVAAGRGVGAARFGIVPGSPEDSILFHRLVSVDPGVRMPVVGRSVVHEEGVALIREWIETMPRHDLEQAQKSRDAARSERLRILRQSHAPLVDRGD